MFIFVSTNIHTYVHMQVVPVLLPHITKFSSVRLYLPKDLRSSDNRKVVRTQVQEVKKRFPDGLPQLDPVKDMHISDEGFKKIVQVYMYMGDEKEGRKKQARSNKQQLKAKQHSTPKAVIYELPRICT